MFKPCYVWPNEVIPFRVYYNSNGLRIFIIENLQHNFTWLDYVKDKIKDTDVFFVIIGCHYHDWLVNEARMMFDYLGLNSSNFYIMYNDDRERDLFTKYGFSGAVVNQNAWLDENGVMKAMDIHKLYDAIYVGRAIEVKRHYLASQVDNLALVVGDSYSGVSINSLPSSRFLNDRNLLPHEVCELINKSRCGLILSDKEGASFVTSEYLLCGIPVISTVAEGGRMVWLNESNSIIVEPDSMEVASAVKKLASTSYSSYEIRASHIELQNYFRQIFIDELGDIFNIHNVNISAVDYFKQNFYHKMRSYYRPNFDEIWF